MIIIAPCEITVKNKLDGLSKAAHVIPRTQLTPISKRVHVQDALKPSKRKEFTTTVFA